MSSIPLACRARPLCCFAAAALAVSSTVTLAQPEAPRRTGCSVSGARFAVGETYTPELAERAREAARARIVRKIERGGAYTMEFSPDRLNIEVDGAGIVRDLTCG